MYLQEIVGILQSYEVKIKYDCDGEFENCGKEKMLKLRYADKNFKDNNYAIDVMVFVNDMDVKELGSAMIHKYVKNDDNNLILPTNAIMRVNKRFLSKDKKDKINVKLIFTV